MDTIFIRDFRLDLIIGIYDWEREKTQSIQLDIDVALRDSKSADTDDIHDTIDYGSVVERIRSLIPQETFYLVEKLAERIAGLIQEEFGAPGVRVRVTKHNILPAVASVGIQIERGAI